MTDQTDTEAEALTPVDEAALRLAIEVTRRKNSAERRRVDQRLARGEDWTDVAAYCAFHRQCERLHLPPWAHPPCNISDIATALNMPDEHHGYRAAALLLQRMLAAGISRWHPDPASECDRIEAERAKNQPAK